MKQKHEQTDSFSFAFLGTPEVCGDQGRRSGQAMAAQNSCAQNGCGAWLRTRGTGFESDQIQGKQKVTIPEQTEADISEPLDRSPQAKQGSLPKAGAERSALAGSAREECHKHSGI